jgi:hypothetical protein
VATSGNTFFRTLGQTYGVAALGAVLAATVRSDIIERLPETTAVDVRRLVGSPRTIRALPAEQRDAVIGAVAHGVHNAYLVTVPLALVVLVLGWMLHERPLRTTSGIDDARAAAALAME